MRKITDAEFKSCVLSELKYFVDFCNKYDIQYYLFYGTLIGAARHNGLIPWDDDVDIVIPRNDYIKLVELFNVYSSRYRLISVETDDNFTAPLAKIIDTSTLLVQNYSLKEKVDLGVYLDIFVLDGMPDEIGECKKHYAKAKKLTSLWFIANHKFRHNNSNFIKDFARYIKHISVHLKGYKYYLNKITKHCNQYNYEKSKNVAILSFAVPIKNDEFFPKEYFHNFTMNFEGIDCNVPIEYDKILTAIYGDWRKLPPKKLQVSNHDFECYILEDK